MNPTLSIIIPAYNEEKRIEKTLEYISFFLRNKKISFEIIVVANNCTDNTVKLLNNIKNNLINEIIIINIPKKGVVGNMKGYAIGTGMKKATGKYHVFIDADNATHFDEVLKFMNYIDNGFDVVIGSRYIEGSYVVRKQPFYRIFLSRLGNILIQTLLIPGVYDTQCGFKMFSNKASNVIFSKMTLNGWGADFEMLAIARTFGFKIKEASVKWEAKDESSIKTHSFFNTFRELLEIRKKMRNHFYR
jgi:dolichyl-phosphate beta-glucosyltransferase